MKKAEAELFPASACSLLIASYLVLRFLARDTLLLLPVVLLLVPTPASFLVVLLAVTLLRVRTPVVVLLADFVAASMP